MTEREAKALKPGDFITSPNKAWFGVVVRLYKKTVRIQETYFYSLDQVQLTRKTSLNFNRLTMNEKPSAFKFLLDLAEYFDQAEAELLTEDDYGEYGSEEDLPF